jgi:tRNA A37 threonylcarbamoyladenosine biosynthesis protein TsaE
LKNKDDLISFKEFAEDNFNIIEWPEKNPDFWIDEDFIRIKIDIDKITNYRIFSIEFCGNKKENKSE